MCGIGGVRRYGNTPITLDDINILLWSNEKRGTDASGLAIQGDDGKIVVYKIDEPAWKLIASEEYKTFVKKHLTNKTQTVLVHTRAFTQGSPADNRNNHPLWAGVSAVVHNGCLRNDEQLFGELKLKREAETDSDILRAIIDSVGICQKGIRTLARVVGGVAAAAISEKTPNKLLLLRSGGPLFVGFLDDKFYFASESKSLHQVFRPWVRWRGLDFQESRARGALSVMANDSAWVLNEKGLEWHQEFVTCASYTEPIRRVYENYGERKERSKYASTWTAELSQEGVVLRTGMYACEQKKCPTNMKGDAAFGRKAQLGIGMLGLSIMAITCPFCKKPLGLRENLYKRAMVKGENHGEDVDSETGDAYGTIVDGALA